MLYADLLSYDKVDPVSTYKLMSYTRNAKRLPQTDTKFYPLFRGVNLLALVFFA